MTPGSTKIVVIGISGTGKSRISREIAKMTALPVHHMDGFIWGENWKESDPKAIEQALLEIARTDGWIVEGWIDSYSKNILEQADLVIYLDYTGWMAMWGGMQRWWTHRGEKRPEMPKGCNESLDLAYLKIMLLRKERPQIEKVLGEFRPKNVIRCSSRRQASKRLSQLFGKIRNG